jgi:hypothetical protein
VSDHVTGGVDAVANRDGERQERKPGLERLGPEHVLPVQRREQERSPQHGGGGEHQHEAAADGAVDEALDAQQRRPGAQLEPAATASAPRPRRSGPPWRGSALLAAGRRGDPQPPRPVRRRTNRFGCRRGLRHLDGALASVSAEPVLDGHGRVENGVSRSAPLAPDRSLSSGVRCSCQGSAQRSAPATASASNATSVIVRPSAGRCGRGLIMKPESRSKRQRRRAPAIGCRQTRSPSRTVREGRSASAALRAGRRR